MARYDLLLTSDCVKYSSVAVGEDRHRQSVVPHEVENSKRLSRAERQTCNSDLIDLRNGSVANTPISYNSIGLYASLALIVDGWHCVA